MLMKNKFQSVVAKAPQNTGGGNSQCSVLQYESALLIPTVNRRSTDGQSQSNSPLNTLKKAWKYVACMLLALVLGVGNMWGDTFTAAEIVNKSGDVNVGTTKNHVTVSSLGITSTSSVEMWKNGNNTQKENAVSIQAEPTSSGDTYDKSKSFVEIKADRGYKLGTTLSVCGGSTQSGAKVAVAVYWAGAASPTFSSYDATTLSLQAKSATSYPSNINLTIPDGTRTARIYKKVKVTDATNLISGNASSSKGGGYAAILSVTATAVLAPEIDGDSQMFNDETITLVGYPEGGTWGVKSGPGTITSDGKLTATGNGTIKVTYTVDAEEETKDIVAAATKPFYFDLTGGALPEVAGFTSSTVGSNSTFDGVNGLKMSSDENGIRISSETYIFTNAIVSAKAGSTNKKVSYNLTTDAPAKASDPEFATVGTTFTEYNKDINSQVLTVYRAGGSTTNFNYIIITAKKAVKHTLSYAVIPAGKATVTLSKTSVAEGGTATATYSDIDGAYEFDEWQISGTGASIDNAKANPVTVTMGTDNAVVTLKLKPATTKYAVAAATGLTGGSVAASVATEAAGETVTITATPAFRYLFGAWDVYKTGDPTTKVSVTETAGVFTFEMPAYPVTVSASFTADGRKQILYLTTAATGSDKLYAALNADATYNVIVEAPASQTLTNYDLVVLHESLDGKNAASGILHNVATAAVPVLNTKSYFYNNANTTDQRWNWGTPNNGDAAQKVATLNTSYSNIADHPIFDGVTITANIVKVLTDDVTSGNTMQPIGIFTTGKEGYTLATTPNKNDDPTPDGCAIHELTPTQRGVDSGKYLMISVSNAGLNNLTADGQKLFKNAAAYLLDGEAAWDPAAAATDDATLKALSVSGLTLSPTFAAATVNYTVTKAYGADDPAESDVTATPTADGASAEVEWDETNKKFVITVTAVDNTTTKEYTITVNEAAAPKSLSRVLFSNGFDAFIDNTNHTVKAYYLAGATAPTATTITAGAGTAGEYAEGKITVTGDDASTVDYIVTLEAVTPNTTTVAEEAAAGEFAGDEAWVKNGLLISGTAAGFNADGKYYVNRRLLKSSDEADDQRVIAGWVRSYFFVGNAYKFIMTVSNNNAIKYSVDGGEQVAINAATVEITLPAGNHMIEIVSNQSSGDCRLSAPKLVERPATYTVTYTAGEGTGDDVTDDFEYAAGDEVTVQENAFTAPANKKFNGWASAPAVTISEGKFEMPASNVELTAQWKEYFTITYMDGEDVLGTEDVFVGEAPVGIADPVKAMNIFQGWTLAGSEDLVDVATLTAAKTLYAKWEAIDACFYFAAKSVTEDEAITAPANLDDAFGGTVEATSGTFTYTQYGVLIAGGGDKYFTVNLDYALQEGSKIALKLYAGGTSGRGLNLRVAGSSSNVYQYKWTPSDTEPAQMEYEYEYVVPANSPLIGKKVFYLYRNNNVYLQTVMVKDCAPQDYTVTYKDGETVLGTEQVFENEHPTADGINTHKKGYEFQGWAETADGDVVDLDDITITAAKTLYAQYTVKDCSPKGVKFSMAVDPAKAPASNLYYPETTPAVGDLAVFATVTGGVAQAVNTSTGTTKNFEVNKEPYFKLSGSESHMRILLDCPLAENDTIKFDKSEKIVLSFDSLKTKSENIAKNTSYYIVPATYAGEDTIHIWYDGNGVKVNGVQVIRPEIYAVSFNLMGHGSAIAPIDVVKGSKITAPTAPTDEDYAFAGWYKENTLENEWDFANDVVDEDITLYAKWIDMSDATLKSLKYGDEEIALVDGVYEYNISLPALTTAVPALTAVTNNPNANAAATNAAAFDESGNAQSTVLVTPEKDGAATQTYTVNFSKAATVTLKNVTGAISWDFADAVTEQVTIENTLQVLANYAGVTNDDVFESDKLEAKGTFIMISPKCIRANQMHFYTTVPGKLTVEYSNTGNKPVRYLYVNGVKYDEDGSAGTAKKGGDIAIFVPAGDVMLEMKDGDDAYKELNIYTMTFSTTPDYPRPVSNNYGTLCVDHNVPAGQYFGATFYQIASRNEDYDYKIDFEEVLPNEELKAGEPYLFKSNTGKIELFYGAETAATPKPVRGMIGNYEATTLAITAENMNTIYYFAQNKLWLCDNLVGSNLILNEHRAYIDLTQVPTYAEYEASKQQQQNSAPRRRVSLEMNGEKIATGCENLNVSDKPVKMIINGQLFILRGEKMYDAKGQLVK